MELEEEKTLPVILKELLSSRQYTKLRQTISDMNTTDIAAAMSEMEEEDSLKMFRILPKDMAEPYIKSKQLRQVPLVDFNTPVINSYIIYKKPLEKICSDIFKIHL